MFVKIEIGDLTKLVNVLKLNEIAFTLPETHGSKSELKRFNEIENISIEIRTCVNKCLIDLMNNFTACKKLELFSNKRLNLSLNFEVFSHQFKNLKALIGSGSVYFNIADILQKKLESFNLKVHNNSLNIIETIQSLKQSHKFKNLELNLTRDSFPLLNVSQVNEQIEIDHLTSELLTNDLEEFKLTRPLRFDCVLNSVRSFKISNSKWNLKTLDLKDIHIHSSESICEMLANLKSNCIQF